MTKLNEDGTGASSSVSADTSTDYSLRNFNARQYSKYNLAMHTLLNWSRNSRGRYG